MTTMRSDINRLASPPAFQGISTGRKTKNLVATTLVGLSFLIAVIPLVWVLYSVLSNGIDAVTSAAWWNNSQKGIRASSFGGGAYHAIYGTVIQGLICSVFAVPIGVMVAVYLVEYGPGTKFAKVTTFMVDILTGVPSIVAGLFVFAVWIVTMGNDRSSFAVALALVLLMVPVVIRTTEEMLKIVPNELREASYALGVPKWKTIVKIVIPTALSGIITGIMLGLARVMGETAPALIVGAYADYNRFNPFSGNMGTLPLFINEQMGNAEAAGEYRVWGAALTLVIIIMLFNFGATLVSRLSAIKTK
ncbi:phosphate ABC transporter permease PstA [Pseudonocardiaceae bacterium YIM PH 21723]|nr:phosphate ABC transporter permease PstA [Pseudonocardiaceae bacterium YIM PH 21723]